tara:strand:+ start:4057 stop:4392 length:336 start_codon:yes stop_codon:yes gene_type:complete
MPTFPKKKIRPWIPVRKKGSRESIIKSTDIQNNFQSFYNSKRWRSLRNYYLSMNPLCKTCEEAGYCEPGTDIDHVIPLRLGGTNNLDNLQTLCRSCHARKSGAEAHVKSNG